METALTESSSDAPPPAAMLGSRGTWTDVAIVAAIVLVAVAYLYRKFNHRSGLCSSCPAGSSCGKQPGAPAAPPQQ